MFTKVGIASDIMVVDEPLVKKYALPSKFADFLPSPSKVGITSDNSDRSFLQRWESLVIMVTEHSYKGGNH